MNRWTIGAIFVGFLFLFGACAQAEAHAKPEDIGAMLLYFGIVAFTSCALFIYCFYAAAHSTQHVNDPRERVLWLIFTIALSLPGSTIYYFTKYQDLRKAGLGGLLRGGYDIPFPMFSRKKKK